MSDYAIRVLNARSEIRIVRTLHIVKNTHFGIGESTPEFSFQFARDFPNEFANGDILTHILV